MLLRGNVVSSIADIEGAKTAMSLNAIGNVAVVWNLGLDMSAIT